LQIVCGGKLGRGLVADKKFRQGSRQNLEIGKSGLRRARSDARRDRETGGGRVEGLLLKKIWEKDRGIKEVWERVTGFRRRIKSLELRCRVAGPTAKRRGRYKGGGTSPISQRIVRRLKGGFRAQRITPKSRKQKEREEGRRRKIQSSKIRPIAKGERILLVFPKPSSEESEVREEGGKPGERGGRR